jgi:YD repeat-containing protein
LLRLQYAYGTTQNNGNVLTQTITAPSFTATQSYSYDALNRLQSAQETNSASQSWTQGFSYDRYGNRRIDEPNTTQALRPPAGQNPTINPDNNRYHAGQGYSYDTAGNLTSDVRGFALSYDGENRLTQANDGQAGGLSTYSYDGDGRRVKKVTGAVTTVFVYNASGQLIAEYSSQEPQRNGTSYLTQDHLGSPRVVTDSAGAVRSRRDYLPFGEELLLGRSGVAGYGALDNVRQQFTGYEREQETGLDYAQARYYANTHGCSLSRPDGITASALCAAL